MGPRLYMTIYPYGRLVLVTDMAKKILMWTSYSINTTCQIRVILDKILQTYTLHGYTLCFKMFEQ